jgi:DNA-binding response OmpR family regulator
MTDPPITAPPDSSAKATGEAAGVILVEDDAALRDSLSEYLQLRGQPVTAVASGLAFYRQLAPSQHGVAVIDLGLPDLRGETLVHYCRQNTPLSIIVLTAASGLDARVQCYRSGADLFLSKPVDASELAAAIESLAERRRERDLNSAMAPAAAPEPAVFTLGAWTFDPEGQRLLDAEGREIATLTWGETQILAALARADGRLVRRATLLACLSHDSEDPNPGSLNALVYRLRRKLAGAGGGADSLIQTLSGVGYRLRRLD